MTTKTPIEEAVEAFSLRNISREILGESDISHLDIKAIIQELKKEELYYSHQAVHGPEKYRHVFSDKAAKIRKEIEDRTAELKNINEKTAPELLKAEMPTVREIEKNMDTAGYKKGTDEYKKWFDSELAFYRKFANIDQINKDANKPK